MKKNALEMMVGLFVLLGVAAMVFLSFRVAGGNGLGDSRPTYTVYASFSDIGGLKVKAPVKAAGVVVGRVTDIQLDPKTYWAKVTLNIDSRYHFSTDTSAQILTSGLLGDQYIGLSEGGDTDTLANGDTITITSSALVLEQLISKFMTSFAENNAKGDSTSDSSDAAAASAVPALDNGGSLGADVDTSTGTAIDNLDGLGDGSADTAAPAAASAAQ